MAPAPRRGIAHFRDAAARTRFLAAYDAMLATWPRAPIARTLDTAFGSTCVQTIGGDSGTPIVLLHALGVSSVTWATFAAAGNAAGHPIHAIDTITDAGRSTPTAPVRTADQLMRWLDQVLDGLGLEHPHLVGASYGAWMALRHALHAPGRVASITAMDPPAAFGRPPVGFVLAMLRGGIGARLDRSDATLYPLLRRLHNGVLPAEPLLELSMASIRGFVVRQPFPKRLTDVELGSLSAPVLYQVGDATPIVDAYRAADRVRRLVPDAEIDVLTGAGHALPIERADEVEMRASAVHRRRRRLSDGSAIRPETARQAPRATIGETATVTQDEEQIDVPADRCRHRRIARRHHRGRSRDGAGAPERCDAARGQCAPDDDALPARGSQ